MYTLMACVRASVTKDMVIRAAFMVCTSVLAISCTIEPSSGTLACNKDVDCPEVFVCRLAAANDVKRCVNPRTPAWQPDRSDAAADAGADGATGGTSDAGKDAAQNADAGATDMRDAGSMPGPEDGGVTAPTDSGLQVTGAVTVLQTVNYGSASVRITEATIEVQPMLCSPSGVPADKRICIIGGIRP